MGKLHFEWTENGHLVIKQCDCIKTDPKKCDACQHRFNCFTERVKPNGAVLSTASYPKFDDLLKRMTMEFDEQE